jgi:sigma-B regulation protein RsbU (phosphoserine phosphatase)
MAKILLVDDSEPNRDMLARRLARRGHVVIQAGDGQQAVDMTRSESPDLILMDLNLPVLDGWTATRQIKSFAATRAVPVIALTAHAMSGDRQKALQAGCDDYDTKPVDFPRLLGKIDALCNNPTPAPSTPTSARAVEAPDPDSSRAATVTPSENGLAGRVLVVDDTEANRDVAAKWLRRKGFAVDTAADGHRALEMLQNTEYDVVVLDVMMPGINGLSVLRQLRESRSPAQLPVIMATAKDASDDVVEALTLGANDYVTKPLDFPVLMARVGTQVALKRSVEQIVQLERGLEQRNRELHDANARMHADLVAAAKIQAALLPTDGPRVGGYRFAWLFEPSATLAGDILNVFSLDDRHVGAYVLDVSGHGVAAALLSVTISRFLSPMQDTSSMLWRRVGDADDAVAAADDASEQVRFEIESPRRVAERLSVRFPFDDVTGQYFTMLYGVLDTHAHAFRYVSAGHPNILHVTADGNVRAVPASGFPIGVGLDEYDEETLALAPGDRIYIHSDGLAEAMSPNEELFDVPRMLQVLREARDHSLAASLTRLSQRIAEWTGSPQGNDDRTVLAIERARS